MAKKDLQLEYAKLFGEAPDDSMTVKQLEAAIEAEVENKTEEVNPPKEKKGRVYKGYVE